MDIRGQLSAETSRRNTDFTIHVIGTNKDHFRELIEIILTEEDPLPMRASWVVEGITETSPELILPYMDKLIKNLPKFTHPGTLRNLLKIFSRMKIPVRHHGYMADLCYGWLKKENLQVAVKVYAMQIIANMVYIYPDLKNEFFEVIYELIPGNSPGFKARAARIIKELSGVKST